jgi:two-component system sensor histidine kinase AlgZ
LLAVNGLMLATALARSDNLVQLSRELTELAASVGPALLLVLSMLFVLSPRLQRLSLWKIVLSSSVLAAGSMAGVEILLMQVMGGEYRWRGPLAAGGTAALLLVWFDLHARAHAPALAEARLAALTARIRPHFFFNSLNTVLSIMREDPRRAEVALEELAELFRVLMRENCELAPLSEEIALARKYLDIERLRLGERLQVRWEIRDCPPDAVAPPLLLQPLLENAVHHGIEPAAAAGEIHVGIEVERTGIHIVIDNPWLGETNRHPGNHMALDNLRERLMLFYDLEARLDTAVVDGRYRVSVVIPQRGRSA